jgi:hypothetical protein
VASPIGPGRKPGADKLQKPGHGGVIHHIAKCYYVSPLALLTKYLPFLSPGSKTPGLQIVCKRIPRAWRPGLYWNSPLELLLFDNSKEEINETTHTMRGYLFCFLLKKLYAYMEDEEGGSSKGVGRQKKENGHAFDAYSLERLDSLFDTVGHGGSWIGCWF